MTPIEQQSLLALLQSMNQTQDQFATRIGATQLLMIGLMRVLKKDPNATLELKRTLAEFAGAEDDPHCQAVVKEARRYLKELTSRSAGLASRPERPGQPWSFFVMCNSPCSSWDVVIFAIT